MHLHFPSDIVSIITHINNMLTGGFDIAKTGVIEKTEDGFEVPQWHYFPRKVALPESYSGFREAYMNVQGYHAYEGVTVFQGSRSDGCFLESFVNDVATFRLRNGDSFSMKFNPKTYGDFQKSVRGLEILGYSILDKEGVDATIEGRSGKLYRVTKGEEEFVYFEIDKVQGARQSSEISDPHEIDQEWLPVPRVILHNLKHGKDIRKAEDSDPGAWVVYPRTAKLDEPYMNFTEVQLGLQGPLGRAGRAHVNTQGEFYHLESYDGKSIVIGAKDQRRVTFDIPDEARSCQHITPEKIEKMGYEILIELAPMKVEGMLGTLMHLAADGKEYLYFNRYANHTV